MKRLILAIQLMTRLPIKKQVEARAEDYAGSAVWFFLTALMTGGVMLGTFFAASLARVPYLAAFLSVIAASLFTGGLHIDGFADMCDAFFARKPKEKTLEILKDSRMGTYGVVAIVFALLVKTLLIGRIGMAPWTLLALPVCGKISMVFCAALSVYPRREGLGKYMVDNLTAETAGWSAVICSVIVVVCAGWLAGGAAVMAALVGGAVLAAVSGRKIGGATGDILGAANEIGEMLFLLAAAVTP